MDSRQEDETTRGQLLLNSGTFPMYDVHISDILLGRGNKYLKNGPSSVTIGLHYVLYIVHIVQVRMI